MTIYRHTAHRQLKNRTQKRRVSTHQYHPSHQTGEDGRYSRLRIHQLALNKIKRQPELMARIWQNLRDKQQQNPEQPQLAQWQQLLEVCTNIDSLSEKVLDYGVAAEQLRQYSVLDCLFDDE